MLKRSFILVSVVFLFFVFVTASAFAASASRYNSQADVTRITVEELKARISSGAEIYILDLRAGSSYATSKVRIPGDIHTLFGKLEETTKMIPKDAEIITYCT